MRKLATKICLIGLMLCTSLATAQNSAIHDAGTFQFLISSTGRFGTAVNELGFVIDGAETLWEGCPLISLNDSVVVVSSHGQVNFQGVEGETVAITEPGTVASEDGYAKYRDSVAEHPYQFEVTQYSYVWAFQSFVLLKYSFKNIGTTDATGVYFGQELDWDIDENQAFNNMGAWDPDLKVAYQYNSAGENTLHCGGVILSPEPTGSGFIRNLDYVYDAGLEDRDEPVWSALMRSGTFQDSTNEQTDWMTVMATGPFDVAVGDSVAMWVAIVAGTSLDEMKVAAQAAIDQFNLITSVEDRHSGDLPLAFRLAQNYPNPFVPGTSAATSRRSGAGTMIEFTLAQPATVRLEIYDITGRRVKTLIEKDMVAGTHRLRWNGLTDSGREAAAGVYVCRLSSGSTVQARRMLLLR